ncbi:hypothetical protein GCM10010521_12610 [Streptomyces rameus]|uniref:Uncharacterized protein n=1 Tax=Streptomyces rameus TaxID=68261 RepID=A0ABP6MX52_9ACTN
MPEQSRLDVLRRQWLGQQRVGHEVDLPDGQVVRRPPMGVQSAQLLLVEAVGRARSVEGDPGRGAEWHDEPFSQGMIRNFPD